MMPRGMPGGAAPLVEGRDFMPRPSLVSSADLYVPTRIRGKMLLGKKAGSEATVGRKPIIRVSFQECPAGSSRRPLEGFFPSKLINPLINGIEYDHQYRLPGQNLFGVTSTGR